MSVARGEKAGTFKIRDPLLEIVYKPFANGSPGLVVMGGDSCTDSNPGATFWMVITFFHIYLL